MYYCILEISIKFTRIFHLVNDAFFSVEFNRSHFIAGQSIFRAILKHFLGSFEFMHITRLRSHTKLTNLPGKSSHSTRVSFTGSLSIYTGQRHIFSYVHTRILMGLIVRYVSKQTTHRNQQNNFTRTQITATTT